MPRAGKKVPVTPEQTEWERRRVARALELLGFLDPRGAGLGERRNRGEYGVAVFLDAEIPLDGDPIACRVPLPGEPRPVSAGAPRQRVRRNVTPEGRERMRENGRRRAAQITPEQRREWALRRRKTAA